MNKNPSGIAPLKIQRKGELLKNLREKCIIKLRADLNH